jgi:hypothetical protein
VALSDKSAVRGRRPWREGWESGEERGGLGWGEVCGARVVAPRDGRGRHARPAGASEAVVAGWMVS